MIRSFKDKRTEAVASGKAPKGFPSDLVRAAQRKLVLIENAAELVDLTTPPGIASKLSRVTARASIRSASTISSAFASDGQADTQRR